MSHFFILRSGAFNTDLSTWLCHTAIAENNFVNEALKYQVKLKRLPDTGELIHLKLHFTFEPFHND